MSRAFFYDLGAATGYVRRFSPINNEKRRGSIGPVVTHIPLVSASRIQISVTSKRSSLQRWAGRSKLLLILLTRAIGRLTTRAHDRTIVAAMHGGLSLAFRVIGPALVLMEKVLRK